MDQGFEAIEQTKQSYGLHDGLQAYNNGNRMQIATIRSETLMPLEHLNATWQ